MPKRTREICENRKHRVKNVERTFHNFRDSACIVAANARLKTTSANIMTKYDNAREPNLDFTQNDTVPQRPPKKLENRMSKMPSLDEQE